MGERRFVVEVEMRWVSFVRGTIDLVSVSRHAFRWRFVAVAYATIQNLTSVTGAAGVGCWAKRAQLLPSSSEG